MSPSDATLQFLVRTYRFLREDLKAHNTAPMLQRFQDRFRPERLRVLAGRELLTELHGRGTRSSLMYWLEFKNDEEFATDRFGGIGGGVALASHRFVYQNAEDRQWYRLGENNRTEPMTEEEAIRVATRQRDQLLAAHQVIQRLPADPSAPEYQTLQQAISSQAPDFCGLGFFHKFLYLHNPDRLDDFHSATYQSHQLLRLELQPTGTGLYAAAGPLLQVRRRLAEALQEPQLSVDAFTEVLNRVNGGPISYWRIGAGPIENGPARWAPMRDQSYVAIGWRRLGNLEQRLAGRTGQSGKEALRAAMEQEYPEDVPQLRGRHTNQIWNFFANVQVGDWVLAAEGQHVFGIGRVRGPYEYVASQDSPHRRSVEWLSLDGFQAPDKTGLQTSVYRLDGKWPMLLAAVKQVPMARRSLVQVPGETPRFPDSGKTPLPLAPLNEPLRTIESELERKGQVILYGPPGTGKTFWALQAANELASRHRHQRSFAQLSPTEQQALRGGGDPAQQRIFTCAFHPAFGYEEFVEGLRPNNVQGTLVFDVKSGLLRQIAQLAEKYPKEQFFLLIDEINRGDIPRIFGELLFLLEQDKRGVQSVVLPYSQQRFSVPANLWIIATMNTADRSISLLDAALRRRFAFHELPPDPGALRGAQVPGIRLDELMRALNQRLLKHLGIDARGQQVGHSFFLHQGAPLREFVHLRQVLRHEVFPLLQEYCYGQPSTLERIVGEQFLDATTRQLRTELFEPGHEEDLRSALSKWGDSVAVPLDEAAQAEDDAEAS